MNRINTSVLLYGQKRMAGWRESRTENRIFMGEHSCLATCETDVDKY